MKIVIQRVLSASVSISGKRHSAIDRGLLLLVGVERGDSEKTAADASDKIANLRIFPVERGIDDRMDRSIIDVDGAALVVPQFTLAGCLSRGRRPSFDGAADPTEAERLYKSFANQLRQRGVAVETGGFRAMMEVELVNDGPVTFVWESSP